MIEFISKLIDSAVSLQKIGRKESSQIKPKARIVVAGLICAVVIAVAQGCKTRSSTAVAADNTIAADKKSTVEIQLYPDTVGVFAGQTVVLSAQSQHDPNDNWKYQWQYVVGMANPGDTNPCMETLVPKDIPGATSAKLTLRHVTANDARLYQCMIYKTGDLPETNFTTLISLQVSGSTRAETRDIIVVPISGSFKPGGTGKGTVKDCGPYIDGICFQSPSGPWWTHPNGLTTASITDNSGFNYATCPAFLEVVSSTFTYQKCWPLPNTNMVFPVSNGVAYELLLYFSTTRPPTGTEFSFTVTYQ